VKLGHGHQADEGGRVGQAIDSAFTDHPNFAPFDAWSKQVPLTLCDRAALPLWRVRHCGPTRRSRRLSAPPCMRPGSLGRHQRFNRRKRRSRTTPPAARTSGGVRRAQPPLVSVAWCAAYRSDLSSPLAFETSWVNHQCVTSRAYASRAQRRCYERAMPRSGRLRRVPATDHILVRQGLQADVRNCPRVYRRQANGLPNLSSRDSADHTAGRFSPMGPIRRSHRRLDRPPSQADGSTNIVWDGLPALLWREGRRAGRPPRTRIDADWGPSVAGTGPSRGPTSHRRLFCARGRLVGGRGVQPVAPEATRQHAWRARIPRAWRLRVAFRLTFGNS
jgi:hypothetical protein